MKPPLRQACWKMLSTGFLFFFFLNLHCWLLLPGRNNGAPHFESPSVKTYILLWVNLFGITFKQLLISSEISFMGLKGFLYQIIWISHGLCISQKLTVCTLKREWKVRKDTIEKRSVKKNILNINDQEENGNTLKANVRAFKYVIKIDL